MDEVVSWVKKLEEGNVPVTIQTTKIGLKPPLSITKLVLGDVVSTAKQRFAVEERLAEKTIFARDVLKFRTRRNVTIFETNYFDTNQTDTNETRVASGALKFYNTGGNVSGGGRIALNNTARKSIDDIAENNDGSLTLLEHLEISSLKALRAADHEAGHIIDEAKEFATKPQSEAFAVAVELGFSFKSSLKRLRVTSEYTREISEDRLAEILSKNPPKGLTQDEEYDVPATFFCYLYEEVGPERFARFYKLLTGEFFETKEGGLDKIANDIFNDGKKQHFKGNLMACLEGITVNQTLPQELLDDYVEKVNKF